MKAFQAIAGALILGLVFAIFVQAQPAPTTNPQTQESQRGGRILDRVKEIISGLNVTPAQQEKLDSVIDNARTEMRGMIQELQQADPESRRKRVQQFRTKLLGDVSNILDPDQVDELRTKLQQMRREIGIAPATRESPATRPHEESPAPTTAPAARVESPPSTILRVGQKAPDFALNNLNGPVVRLSEFKGKIVLLVFGSYSSPMFRQRGDALEQLKRQYSTHINPFIIYTRENFPKGEWDSDRNKSDGISVEQPHEIEGRIALAKQARDKLHLTVPILIDAMDDNTATNFGAMTNVAVLIGRDGNVLAYQKWFEPYAMRREIDTAIK